MIYSYPNIPYEYKNDEYIQIIFITRKKYDYPFVPLLNLDFDDVTKEYCPPGTKQVGKKHIKQIIEVLPKIKAASLVYVCCDAGISRSPAVAKALAHYLGEIESFTALSYKYPFANHDVFEYILLELRRNTKPLTSKEFKKIMRSLQ